MGNTGPARRALLAAAMAVAALLGSPAPALGASFTVNATHDAVDASPGDGVCADSGGACTLRAVVMETNALPGADEIALPAGTFMLSIARENSAPFDVANGDLEITGDLEISGVGATETVIDAASIDRIFYVDPPDPGVEGVKATVSRVTLRGGRSDGGGAIFSFGTVTIEATTITENSASFGGGLGGGGFTLIDSTVAGNTANGCGGISNGGLLTANRSSIIDNTASTSSGGGICANGGPVNLIASTIANNRASLAGGGVFLGSGSLSVENTTISGNTAGTTGGGIHNQPSFLEANPRPSAVMLTNATIASNGVDTGGGLYTEPLSTSAAKNTIVANSTSGGDCSGPVTSLGHNLNSDGTCGFSAPGDISNADPLLLPLVSNGGQTQTHALRPAECGIDSCTPGSPAIDAADNATCPTTDQRGVARPFDGDGDGIAICDMGAHENDQGRIVCGCLPTASPSPAPTPNGPPTLPAALPNTGGPSGGSGLPLTALVAGLPAVLAAALWRARRWRP